MNLSQISGSCWKNVNTGIQNVCIQPIKKKKIITYGLDLDTSFRFDTEENQWKVDAIKDPHNSLRYTLDFVLPDIKFRDTSVELVDKNEDIDVILSKVNDRNEYDIHFKLPGVVEPEFLVTDEEIDDDTEVELHQYNRSQGTDLVDIIPVVSLWFKDPLSNAMKISELSQDIQEYFDEDDSGDVIHVIKFNIAKFPDFEVDTVDTTKIEDEVTVNLKKEVNTYKLSFTIPEPSITMDDTIVFTSTADDWNIDLDKEDGEYEWKLTNITLPNPELSIGTVSPSETADVRISRDGSDSSWTLDFDLPKGEKGDKGDKGDPGEQGPEGPPGRGIEYDEDTGEWYLNTDKIKVCKEFKFESCEDDENPEQKKPSVNKTPGNNGGGGGGSGGGGGGIIAPVPPLAAPVPIIVPPVPPVPPTGPIAPPGGPPTTPISPFPGQPVDHGDEPGLITDPRDPNYQFPSIHLYPDKNNQEDEVVFITIDEDSNLHIVDHESKHTKNLVVNDVIVNKLNSIDSGRYLIGNFPYTIDKNGDKDGEILVLKHIQDTGYVIDSIPPGSPGSLEHFKSSIDTSHPRISHILEPDSTESNVSTIIKTKGTGSFQLSDGGDQRGDYAVDLQIGRINNAEIASGEGSVISGGANNSASGERSVVSGGDNNKALGICSVISGGADNTAEGSFSTISGGVANKASENFSTVSGGFTNQVEGNYSVVSGGSNNKVNAHYSGIVTGDNNEIKENQYQPTLPNQLYAIIASGRDNKLDARYGFIGGGYDNEINIDTPNSGTSFYPTILNGRRCKIVNTDNNYSHSLILNGDENKIYNAAHSTIVNGRGNTIDGHSYTTLIGRNLKSSNNNQVLIGCHTSSSNPAGTFEHAFYDYQILYEDDDGVTIPSGPGSAYLGYNPDQIIFQVSHNGENFLTIVDDGAVIVHKQLFLAKSYSDWRLPYFPATKQKEVPLKTSTEKSSPEHKCKDPFLKEYKIKEGEILEKYDVVKLCLDNTVSKYDYKVDANKEKFIIGVAEEITEENKCLVRIYGETFVQDKISEFLPESWIVLYKSKENTKDLCQVFIK